MIALIHRINGYDKILRIIIEISILCDIRKDEREEKEY